VSTTGDAARLAFGTFTRFRIGPPARVDQPTVRRALLLTPLVGAVLGAAGGVVLELVRTLTYHSTAGRLLAAVLGVGTVVVLCRGLHLDGLADTADAVAASGAGRDREQSLTVMRRSDIGPYGVLALVFVLLVQVTATAESIGRGTGWLGMLTAVVAGRAAVTHACVRGVPAARPDGLGARWAEAWRPAGPWLLTFALAVVMAAAAWADDDRGWRLSAHAAAAVLVAGVAGWAVARRSVARFGGVSGDVLGAVVEVATAVAMLGFALG
jgi:adenosylcobinamide-GDP ribazoletransferase